MKVSLLPIARAILPVSTRRSITRLTRWPPVGRVRFGNLRRVRPISEDWGLERGQPIDRYYIHNFLERNKLDVRGRVLEIGDNSYTRRFGMERVTTSDVLHVAERRSEVNIIGDLTSADHIPSDTYDCVILTQTLQTIYDVPAAIRTVFRILRPLGTALITIPGISKISRYDMDHWGYYWSFTSQSARRLLETAFPADNIEIGTHGNVLASIAFLHGLATEELRRSELDYIDPDFELLITIRAVKPRR